MPRSHSGAVRFRPEAAVAVTEIETVRETLREIVKKGMDSPSGAVKVCQQSFPPVLERKAQTDDN